MLVVAESRPVGVGVGTGVGREEGEARTFSVAYVSMRIQDCRSAVSRGGEECSGGGVVERVRVVEVVAK